MIKEVIIVEGKDDIAAVKKAVEAEVLSVNGFGINREILDRVLEASRRKGIIVLMDPDFAGERIRRIITKRIQENVKHAYIDRAAGTRDGNVGVENASPEVIRRALEEAKAETEIRSTEFQPEDMLGYGLMGQPTSKALRRRLGTVLGIGYGNSSAFLSRLNAFGITRRELEEALHKDKEDQKHGQ